MRAGTKSWEVRARAVEETDVNLCSLTPSHKNWVTLGSEQCPELTSPLGLSLSHRGLQGLNGKCQRRASLGQLQWTELAGWSGRRVPMATLELLKFYF